MKMMKYSSTLIRDYLNGEDIQNYEIEQLENDPIFMTEVILISEDKNMYEMCSDEVKGNYEFATFLIDKFIEDKKFVSKVAINYISNEKNNELKNQMCIYLNNLSYKHDDMEEYRVVANNIYNVQMSENEAIVSRLDESTRDEIGCGFCLILDEYPNSKIIHDFFSINMLDDILSNIKIEPLMHRFYKNADEVLINNFLLSLVRNDDKYLALYLENNLYLLKSYQRKIENFKKRWDFYEKNLVEEALYQFEILNDKMYNGFSYLSEEFLIHVIKKYKLECRFENNSDYLMKKEFLETLGLYERDMDVYSLSSKEQIFLLEIESIINNIFFEDKKDIIKSENKKFVKVNFRGSI